LHDIGDRMVGCNNAEYDLRQLRANETIRDMIKKETWFEKNLGFRVFFRKKPIFLYTGGSKSQSSA